jgi:hypothetical protein
VSVDFSRTWIGYVDFVRGNDIVVERDVRAETVIPGDLDFCGTDTVGRLLAGSGRDGSGYGS